MSGKYSVAVLVLAFSTLGFASDSYVVPTTTLAAQTSNNTSAANSFKTQTNNNFGAGNISKVDVHSLLYSGATTKIYAHMVLWFGQSNHMNIGYSETDAQQVTNQIDDMVSRGIDGVVIDWYGPGNSIDQATKLVMAQAEAHPGFTFAIMIDQGAIQWYSCGGCSPQQALVTDLQYIEQTYFPSPAYMKVQGQPMITNFNVSLSYPSVDWNAATATMSTRPTYIFQNNNGFTQALTDGSYAWVMPTTTDYGISYLTSFYKTGMNYPSQETMGATYKGFNDTLASWGSNRIMAQQCGQTWLQTFAEINSLYNSSKPLNELQLVTWNDYEEATEVESGIDNCFSLSPSLSANALQWNISGDENTVDHYTVYISADGQNLMPLTNLATGNRSLNLCSFPIPNASYSLFVQAVGKPTLANQISGAISYDSSCVAATPPPPPPPPTPSAILNAAPNAITVSPGASAAFTVTAQTQSGNFNTPISLSCSGLPKNLSCSFSPASITPGSGVATSTVTISAAAGDGVNGGGTNFPKGHNPLPIAAGLLLPFGIGGFAFVGSVPRKRRAQLLALFAVVAIGMAGSSCGGGTGIGSQNAGTQVSVAPVTNKYSVTIQGQASTTQLSTVVNVIVQ
jgi:hypothetical protein